MRLAIFCNDYWPTIGGVQTAVRGLAAGLRRQGADILILTRQPGGAPAEEDVDGIPVRRFEWNLAPVTTFPLRAHRARAQVRVAAGHWRPDAVYAHFVSVHAIYAWDCARDAGAPLALSFRGNDVMRIAPRSLVTRRAYAALTAAADVNLFCSPWLMHQAVGAPWFRGTPGRTGVLADAVEVGHRLAPSAPPQRPFVLAGGRMVHKKGFDLLLRAWARVEGAVEAPLLLAGDGPEAAALRDLASSLRLGDRVRFLGAVAHPELLGLLEQAELCIVPSREEPYGIFVLEAQALGVPTLATAVGNLPELIEDGRSGYLAPPDVEGLAERIVAAWRDPGRRAVGKAGRTAPGAVRDYDRMAGELRAWITSSRSGAGSRAAWS